METENSLRIGQPLDSRRSASNVIGRRLAMTSPLRIIENHQHQICDFVIHMGGI